jgi:dihydropteroate synthase
MMVDLYSRRSFALHAGDWILNLGERTLVMGILNVTPDSFSDKGRYFTPGAAVDRAWQIAEEGADILDIGGESTRPGSLGVSAKEEMQRVLPILEALEKTKKYPIPISVDTSKAAVAKAALERGASIINDISSLQKDPAIGYEAARCKAALILMHMRGEPSNMQTLPSSTDILGDLEIWAQEAVARAKTSGVSSDRVVLDPGIGFGKTAFQNMEIIANLHRLAAAGFPILIGTSRKSFISSVIKKPAHELAIGTCATVTASIIYGAHIVRVHDVSAVRETVDITDAIVKTGPHSHPLHKSK